MTILHGGIATFLKAPVVEPERSALEAAGANVAVIGLPDDTTTVTRPGASHGPRAVRDASAHFAFGEYYHYDYDVTISDYLTIVDCGDIDAVAGNAARTFERAAAALDEIYAASCLPVLIGGDHATTIPGARALARHTDGAMGFVMFDTHLDTAPDIDGEELSHCSPVHRVLDLPNVRRPRTSSSSAPTAPPTRSPRRTSPTRTASPSSASATSTGSGSTRSPAAPLEIAGDGTETTYLSIDIDVLDGAFAWGTCGPEIGGMTGRELVRAIEIVAAGPIGAVDMVEVSPFLDPSGNTARAGARCVIDVLALRAIAVREATAPVAAAGRG